MLNKKQNILRETLTVVLLLASVALAEYWFFQLWRLDWKVPMLYGGDGIYWVGQIQRSFGELTGSLGWPFYQAPSPYEPNYDLVYDIFVAFVGLFTKDTGTVFNLYILAIPFANALAGYTVFRMVGMRRWLSYGFGMTFGLCAYVQQRLGGHMMLAAVEFVPFSVLLCLWCAEDPNFNKPGKGFFKNKRNWLALAMAWGIANNGAAYYPYFTCFFLCVTALCLMLRRGHLQPAHQQFAAFAQRLWHRQADAVDPALLPDPLHRRRPHVQREQLRLSRHHGHHRIFVSDPDAAV